MIVNGSGQPTSFPIAGSAHLPTSTYCPVSSVNQSGGQVIVNGSGQPTSFLMAGSAQLPTSTYCPVSSVSQSSGQVIVTGSGLNLNINRVSTDKGKHTPKPFVLKLKANNIQICQSCR